MVKEQQQEEKKRTDYSYAGMSNLVLQADRRLIGKRSGEATGEAASLWGKIQTRSFGDRVRPDVKKNTPAMEMKGVDQSVLKKGKKKENGVKRTFLEEGLEHLGYQPKTKPTMEAYDLILILLSEFLIDASHEMLVSAADETIAILKDDLKKDFDRQKEIESILSISNIPSQKFSELISLGKKLTDFGQDEEGGNQNGLDEGDQAGVAVVFDEESDGSQDYAIGGSDDDASGDEGVEASIGQVLARKDVLFEEEEQDANDDFTSVLPSNTTKEGEAFSEKLNPSSIDAFWLQRSISAFYPDAVTGQAKTESVLDFLKGPMDSRDVENELIDLFDYQHFGFVKTLIQNRQVISWCTLLNRAESNEEKAAIEQECRDAGCNWILIALSGAAEQGDLNGNSDSGKKKQQAETQDDVEMGGLAPEPTSQPKQVVDLEALAFEQGGHFMSNKKVKLPEGTFKQSKKGYEEIHVPAPVAKPMAENEKLRPITSLPSWARAAFVNSKSLNRVQSRVYPAAFESDENMLLCAPTGAGKTNCAMLTIMREIGKHRIGDTSSYNLDNFKIVYVAPMKALVSEMVGNFSSRLAPYGVNVRELTGDRQLTKQQISDTQIIVTTPEKWDIITRKATDRSYTKLVRLIIVDEIHLLHDMRGPVLEAIISRTLRQIEQDQEMIRLVGLSATLPNYKDVATFMRVDPIKGLFFFDNSFRPCPLKQQYVGITEKKAIKRLTMMNEICYEKILEELGKNQDNQVMIFCHSRKETAKTALAIRDMAIANDTIGSILRSNAASREIVQSEAESCKNDDLKTLLPYGFAIHHAGMAREDRTMVEDLYAARHIPVLVSTATLAWGVNLPAHTVIIKGTQVYNPELGRWTELSPQDMLQMLGRAGRPQYDTFGEGVIITTHQELQYYLSLLNQQLPIESQLISRLPDIMNAEIVMGNISGREEAVQWMGYTYLYVRMLRNGSLYGVTYEDAENDSYLVQKRIDFVHSAAIVLEKGGLIRYDRKTGKFQGTELGRIASYYYISYQSMATYNQHLKPSMSLIDLFRVFALSEEFKLLPIRQEEKLELAKMLERVPIPIKEGLDEPSAKINVLLQAYISQLKLEGFALMSDMVFVTQSAGRIIRAIFEICLKRGWAQMARKALDLCKMVDKRSWLSMNPLRQFPACPLPLITKLERKDISWDKYLDMDAQHLGELVAAPTQGKNLHRWINQFPKLHIDPIVQPITRSMLKVEVDITPIFEWDENVHGGAENFWIFVEDVDAEIILYHENFLLKSRYAQEMHTVSFTVPLYEPLPPNYFISFISDRWLHVETRVPIILRNLLLPEKNAPHTELLDLQPLPVSALRNEEFQKIYEGYEIFNPIQTQVFNTMFNSDENSLICSAAGSGKTVCAEFALLRLWATYPKGRCVYICPMQASIECKAREWKQKFGSFLKKKEIVCLTGESAADLKLLEIGDIIFATPEQWDALSRRWKQRKNVQNVGLFVADDIHLLNGENGPVLEVIVSRMRYISVQTGNSIRIIALGASIANARDFGEWIGANNQSMFNFHPSVRPVPLDIYIQGYNVPHFPSMMLAMSKPAFNAINTLAGDAPTIIFVPNRKQSRITALEMINFALAESSTKKFLNCDESELEPFLEKIDDKTLPQVLSSGVAFYHEALSLNDKRIVESLFSQGAIQVLVASRECVWSLELRARLVIIMGSQYFEGREHRYVDYSVSDILQMMGRASRSLPGEVGKAVLMCTQIKREFYKKFLHESLPVESHLNHFLHDHFNAEVVTKTIENKQDAVDYLTWTFFYRRMALNPNYYDLQGVTHQHLSDHLSELVEKTLEELAENKCISVEEDEISALNLGMIASYYYINYRTIQSFSLSLKSRTRLQVLLDIITGAVEYEHVPIRHHEDVILSKIHDRLPRKYPDPNFNDPHFKASILLQGYFSRFQLSPDLESDQKFILSKVIRLLQACVDVLSSNGWLGPALSAMELSQMCVQAIWDKDSPLKQIPHFTPEIIERLTALEVEQVSDLLELDSSKLKDALKLQKSEMRNVINYVNRFPNIEVEFSLSVKDIAQGDSATLTISLERELDEDEQLGPVIAPFYPGKKEEGWWLVIGDPETKTLLAVKRITLQHRLSLELDFSAPETKLGPVECKLYLMCDSYMGADQEFEFEINVLPGEVQEDEE